MDVSTEDQNVSISPTNLGVETQEKKISVETDTSTIEGKKKEYSIVGDALYASVNADEAPPWLTSIVTKVVDNAVNPIVNDVNTLSTSVLNAVEEIETAKNIYTEQVNIAATVDSVVTSKLSTLNATIDGISSSIIDIQSTYTTKTEAAAIAVDQLKASIDEGAIGTKLSSIENAVATSINSMATSIDTLEANFTDNENNIAATASALHSLYTYTGVDENGDATGGGIKATLTSVAEDVTELQSGLEDANTAISANTDLINTTKATLKDDLATLESKFAYNSELVINGSTYTSGFGIVSSFNAPTGYTPTGTSEFWINAEKLRFTNENKTGASTPFSIDTSGSRPVITFNGHVTFGNGQTGTVTEAIQSTSIDGSQIVTGTLNADRIGAGYIKTDQLDTSSVSSNYSGTIMDRKGIRVYENGVLRVKIGNLS